MKKIIFGLVFFCAALGAEIDQNSEEVKRILSGTDAHEILGVARGASKGAIEKAYKLLSKKYHPDKNATQLELANKIFKKIGAAKDKLLKGSDSDEGVFEGAWPPGGFSRGLNTDFFDHFFRGTGSFKTSNFNTANAQSSVVTFDSYGNRTFAYSSPHGSYSISADVSDQSKRWFCELMGAHIKNNNASFLKADLQNFKNEFGLSLFNNLINKHFDGNQTLLVLAIKHGSLEMVKLLLSYGADPLQKAAVASEKDLDYPMHVAQKKGFSEIVNLLRPKVTEKLKIWLNEVSCEGKWDKVRTSFSLGDCFFGQKIHVRLSSGRVMCAYVSDDCGFNKKSLKLVYKQQGFSPAVSDIVYLKRVE